jgi:hypothetical protein
MDPHDWSMWNSIILRAFDEPVAEQLADRRRKVWSVDARWGEQVDGSRFVLLDRE